MKLQQALHPGLVKRLQHMVFVGVVLPREESSSRFFVTCLSPVPQAIMNVAPSKAMIFEGIVNDKGNEKLLPVIAKHGEKKHVVVFRLRYASGFLYAELLQVREETPCEAYRMIPIPYIEGEHGREALEKKLVNGYVSFALRRYPSDFEAPELLLCNGRLYGNVALKATSSSIMYTEQKREVVYDDLENWDGEEYILVEQYVYFVSEKLYEKLKRQLLERGERLLSPEVQPANKKEKGNAREVAFLQYVKAQALQRNLYFDEVDVYNLHICVKTSPLTIVAGMPGIGKSQVVKLYAEALGLEYGKELLWIPVSPSFQEPQDILGYYHPNGTYMESDTGLLKLLLQAQEQPEQLYIVVFDEMNLSYVEHWFTTFLSLLELAEEERVLSLYTGAQNGRIPPFVKVASNIRFVGTINFDETTKDLSDRVLDRAPIVAFRKISFREAIILREKAVAGGRFSAVSAIEYCKHWSRGGDVLSLLLEEELELLDALHEVLQAHEPSKGVSFRIARTIALYLCNIPRDEHGVGIMSREEAFDLQLKQRIFTKLRGIEAVIGPLLKEQHRQGSSLLQLLQSPLAQSVSTFSHSLSCLKEKARELELYGYVR